MQKIILVQVDRGLCEVRLASDMRTDVLFWGGRVACKHYIKRLRSNVGWENVPAFCQKRGRGKTKGALVEMP